MIQILLYIGFIILADVLAARWVVPIGLGLFVPLGAFAIAPIFTLRDSLHHKYGAKVVTGLILLASVISYFLSVVSGSAMLGRVTIASVVAFLVSENSDTLVYHLLRKESWMRRVILSNTVSTFLDSLLFIGIAFGIAWPLVFGQYIVKMILAALTGLFLQWTKRPSISSVTMDRPTPLK